MPLVRLALMVVILAVGCTGKVDRSGAPESNQTKPEATKPRPPMRKTRWVLVDPKKYPYSKKHMGYVIQRGMFSKNPKYLKLAKEAARASERKDYKTALAKAEAALAIEPHRMAPLSTAATSACHLGQVKKAIAFIKRLKGIWIDVAIDLCKKAGVKFPKGSVQHYMYQPPKRRP